MRESYSEILAEETKILSDKEIKSILSSALATTKLNYKISGTNVILKDDIHEITLVIKKGIKKYQQNKNKYGKI